MANIFGVNIGNVMKPTKEEYAAGTAAGVYTGGYGDVAYGQGGLYSPDSSYLKGLFYEAEGAAEEQAPKATRERPTAAPSGGGGSSYTAPAAPAAPAYKAPPPPPPPPIFRSNVKTGAEAGSDFKMFMGGKFANKLGMTAGSLRIGGAAARGTTRDIEKKKQLNTLGLNIASPSIGLGI